MMELYNAKQGDNGVRFSADDVDAMRIKDQIRQNQDKLNAMDPVVYIRSDGRNGRNASQMRDALIEFFGSRKYVVDRQGFGAVLFNADALRELVKYVKTDAEFAAIKAAPAVIKRGIEIHFRENHKGRGISSYTFAAPAILNGKHGNDGVVVQVTNKSKAHCVRILMPDGSGFNLDAIEKAGQDARGAEFRTQQQMKPALENTIADSESKSNTFVRNSIDTDYLRLAEKYKSDSLSKEDESNYDIDTDAIREAFTVIDTAWKEKRKGLWGSSFVCGFAFSSILALAGGFGLLLALHTGLLVVLTTTDLGEDATAGALALPSLESAFQGFVFSDSDFHFSPSPPEPTIGAKITSTPKDYNRRNRIRQSPFFWFCPGRF